MALRTAFQIGVALSLAAAPLPGQRSPIQWPVPPPGPPREVVLPRILIEPGEVQEDFVVLDTMDAGLDAPGVMARMRSELAARGISGEETVVLSGHDREKVAQLFWRLRAAGCKDVRILKGGLARPSRRVPVERFLAPPGEDPAVDAATVADSLGREGGSVLLDVRDARGWESWRTPPDFAAGHIPTSLPFDVQGLLPPDGGWPDPDQLRQRLATLGARPHDPVPLTSSFVLYGEGPDDPRPALGCLLMTLAGLDAKTYPGGWREWTAGGGHRPIVRVVSAGELAARLRRHNPRLRRDLPTPDLALLDLREPRDFATGHIPGARCLPFLHFADRLESTVRTGWPGADPAKTTLALYCYGVSCIRSHKAGGLAARAGYRDILWFRGGIEEWRDAGYPLSESPLPTASPSPASGFPAPHPPRARGLPGRADGRP